MLQSLLKESLPLLCPHEGLIDGYTGERAALEEQLRQKEELHLSLEQDLQVSCRRTCRQQEEGFQALLIMMRLIITRRLFKEGRKKERGWMQFRTFKEKGCNVVFSSH